jgi:hypothetical protein
VGLVALVGMILLMLGVLYFKGGPVHIESQVLARCCGPWARRSPGVQ